MTNDMLAVETFRMTTPARAEAVSKDLKKILTNVRHPMVLGKCREAVARMYGYPDWRSLTGSLGGVPSPDDAEVDNDVRAARREHQTGVLVDVGLERAVAETVVARLSPTGRTSDNIKDAIPVALELTTHYHPNRLQQAVDHVVQTHKLAQNASLTSIYDAVEEWSQDVPLLPLDVLALHEYCFEDLYEHSRDIRSGTGRILDASVAAGRLAQIPIRDAQYAGEWAGMPRVYVHLGTNAFPSPWPGCGIEGCYITVEEPGMSLDERQVTALFVVSAETAPDPDLGIQEDFTGGLYDEFVHANRHVLAIGSGELDENREARPVRLMDLLDGLGHTNHEKDYVDAWRPYLLAPFTAAWNAVRSWKEGALPIRYGLISDLPEDLFLKLARARTDEQRDRAIARVAEYGESVVHFIGGVPKDDGRGPIAEVDFPYPDVTDPEDWAAGYLEMALGAAYPSVQLHLARKATAMMAKTDAREHVDTKILAMIHEETALAHLGRWDEALAVARRCLAFDERDERGVRYRMASLVIRKEDSDGARELLAHYDADPLGGATAKWGKALLLARFGTPEQAKAAIAKAVAEAPHVRDRLLGGDGHPEFWYDRGMYDYVSDPHGDRARTWEAYVAAGMLRDGWTALPDHRSLLG
jgi:tetratricopeptide (TPR) repeat protein